MPPRAAPRLQNQGLAIRAEEFGSEANLIHRFRTEIPFTLGPQTDQCTGCGAFRWKAERRVKDANLLSATFRNCCNHGQIDLPLRYFPEDVGEQVPEFYRALLRDDDQRSRDFRDDIQKYNNGLSFTSLGAKIDGSVIGTRGHSIFRIHGQMFHLMGSLMPLPENHPGFAQLYIYGGGGEQEARLRIERTRVERLNPEIMLQLQNFMYEVNPYAQRFRSAAEICNENAPIRTLRINTVTVPGTDHRRYNRPTANEVAAIIEGNGEIGRHGRDIILRRQSGVVEAISELHTAYFALRYPLLFPYGSQMWHDAYTNPTEDDPEGTVTCLKWFAFLLFKRPAYSVILASGRLFQEFVVDMYVCVEHARLNFIRFHQRELRAELYSGIVEALGNEVEEEVVGRRVVLPSTFVGGPRNMQALYQDAMSLVAEFGHPSLFITMTANPQWSEITDALEDNQIAEDRPDLVARAFHLRFHAMLSDVTKWGRLGKFTAYVYSIEFQKRGLPHAHLILFLDANSKPSTPEMVDCLISAQLPDPEREPDLSRLVSHHMLHGPCRNYKCWDGTRCKIGYPKPFCETTTLPDNKYPTYKRPCNGRYSINGGTRFDNGSVVPYNRFLLLKYQCHMNVEVAASLRAIKYLFKYILKGHDRTMANVEEANNRDEVLAFLNARFLSAPEAVWRLFQYELAGRYPAVQRLNLHLEDAQTVYYLDEAGLRRGLATGRAERTTLTEYFRLCNENCALPRSELTIRSIKYQEVPKYFRWVKSTKQLQARKNKLQSIGRIYYAGIKRGDIYYLRLLLQHVTGPTSFAALRTVDGVVHSSFREAADQLGLLLNDRHYHMSLTEAAVWKTGHQLRQMLAIILCHSAPANPRQLWTEHIDDLSDDCERRIARLNPELQPSVNHIQNYALFLLEKIIVGMESTLDAVGLMQVDQELLLELDLPYDERTHRSRFVDPQESRRKYETMERALTNEQRNVLISVREAIDGGMPYLGFLDGPGGTGKTFVLNTILHYCNAHDIEFQAVSAAGIASLLLLHGRTAHSAFKIPIPIFEDSVCPVLPNSVLGSVLESVRFIVWDEVAMQHRHAIEAVDRTLRDITGIDEAFGGKVVLFAGDFRQTLPIVRRGNLLDQAAATLKASYLWNMIHRFQLTVNIRLGGLEARQNPVNVDFAKWLLDLGSGNLQDDYVAELLLLYCNVSVLHPPARFDPALVEEEYSAARALIERRDWTTLTNLYAARCLITPLNATVNMLNNFVMQSLPGGFRTSVSNDTMDEAFFDGVSPDVLNTFNFPGFPPHILKLKVGASVMVIRNLQIGEGLCNGTRLLVTNYAEHALECRILTGEMKGTSIGLPKMKLHHEGNDDCPIPFDRYQFPVMPAFCMTINKSQGQSLEKVTVLLPNPVFAHGQLYVALSRCTNAANVHVCITSDSEALSTNNIVYHPVLIN